MYRLLWVSLLIFITSHTFAGSYSIWNHPNQAQSFALQQDLRIFYQFSPSFKLLFETQAKELLTINNSNDHFEDSKKEVPEILSFRIGVLYRIHKN